VLWADVRDGWAQRSKNQHAHPALLDAIDDVFNARIGDVSGRGKLAADMREIWTMQPRFDKRVGSAPFGLVEQPRFRAAFDFMRLRAENGEIDEVLSDWWEEFSLAPDDLRRDMVDQVRQELQQRPRTARVRRGPRPGSDVATADPGDLSDSTATVAPGRTKVPVPGELEDGLGPAPLKHRRRRRSKAQARNGGTPTAGDTPV